MGQWYDSISDDHAEWIKKQKIFFVATAPLDPKGTVNVSPKGHDSLRVLGPNKTQSHLEENGRITVMLMALEGAPRILRLHGTGRVVRVESPEFNQLIEDHYAGSELCSAQGKRAIIMVDVRKMGTTCGYAVPFFDYRGPRETLVKYFSKKDDEEMKEYWRKKNMYSLDGLPGMRNAILGPEWIGINRGPDEEPVFASQSNVMKLTNWITSGTGLANGIILTAGIAIGASIAAMATGRRR
ncbi:hypothetical protein BGZ51_001423 [Haplosporangium sp. Z 767]|nr:hypothetical protein BGZ51_001423 [Haplosporangium sp. Z 767]KAF9188942.1 hypothetical protein BGZ50_001092 [Haplosporangium sp. Z 11]